MVAPKLNKADSETIAKNFLEENPDQEFFEANKKVEVVKEMPQMVKYIFKNNRDPGVALQFHFSWPGIVPLTHYTLFDGHTYEHPVQIVQLLEGELFKDDWSCHKRQYTMKTDHEGVTKPMVSNYHPYYQCKRVRV